MKELKQFIEKYGYFGFIRFGLYPITTLFTNPIISIISLGHSLKLFFVKFQEYPHFDAKPMFNSYFYHIRAWNLKKYGRTGKAPFLGLGNYHLARCFNYSLFSLYSYWRGGAFSMLISMLAWWATYLLWVDFNAIFDIVIWIMAICSTLFFVNLYRYQNYNAVGWAFFPIGLYGLLTGDPLIAAAGWLGASFGSFTAVVLGTILSGIYGFWELNWLLMFSSLPAGIKTLTHFYPFLTNKEAKGILKKVVTAIGAGGNPKYKRKRTKSFDLKKLYFLVLYVQFIIAYSLFTDEIPVLFLACILIYLMNALKIRFADDQSMHMLMLSVGTALMLNLSITPGQAFAQILLIPSYWILISPLPVLAGLDHIHKVLDVLPIYKPLHVKNMISENERFLSSVDAGKKVLFAYPDPNDQYEKLWDGYAQIREMPHYVGLKKDIFCFPDWWAAFELNHEGAENIWGTRPEEVKENVNKWACDFVVIYENEHTPFNTSEWEADFEKVEELDWNQFESIFNRYSKLRISDLKWHLLKPKKV